MTVTINKTDGTVLTTIADGSIDTSSTNIALIGRLYRNYGELINENMVKLLENFANTSSPSTPIIGQLWYDKSAETVKVYRDTGFVPLARLNSSSAEPGNANTGDLWYDTTDEQLKIYANSAWVVIAPGYTASQSRTGTFAETIKDVTTADHIAVVVRQQNVPIAVFSKDPQYTPQTALTGFTSIKTGLNLSNQSGFILQGTAADSQLLDGIDSASFLRSDENDTTTGTLLVSNDSGLRVGASGTKIKLDVSSTTGKITHEGAGNLHFMMDTDLAVVINDSEQLLLQDGTVSVPKLAFINDEDTGFYRVGSGNVAVASNGTLAASFTTAASRVEGSLTVAGSVTVPSLTASSLTVTGNASFNEDVTLGNDNTDIVTVNADTIDFPNDMTFTTGDVGFDGFVTASAGIDVIGNVGITGNTIQTGNVSVTGNVTVTGTFSVPVTDSNDFKIDSLGRVTVNRTSPKVGYDNEGDISLGSNTIASLPRDNAVYSRNTAKHVVTFNGTLAGLAVLKSHHVYTVTRTTTGTYSITLADDDNDSTPLASAYPTVVGSVNGSGIVGYNGSISAGDTSITLYTYNASGSLADFTRVSVVIYDGAN
jgi:hypothetical protein